MKIIVDNLHREYFQEHGILTLEGVIPSEKLEILNQQSEGYDLWRQNEAHLKALNLNRLGMITSELIRQRPIRLGYDHYLPLNFHAQDLQEISSIQGIPCGALIDLTTGNVTFLKPDTPFPEIETLTLLIAFATTNAVYIRQESDPHTHHLKKFGYSFGDRLTHALNPIIYK